MRITPTPPQPYPAPLVSPSRLTPRNLSGAAPSAFDPPPHVSSNAAAADERGGHGSAHDLAVAQRTGGSGATTPFHVTKAYGSGDSRLRLAGSEANAKTGEKAPELHPLAAARVRERVDFSAARDEADERGGESVEVLSMYRHPADKNAAATLVTLGRMLDAEG